MKNTLFTALAILILTVSCTKERQPVIVDIDNTTEKLSENSENDTPQVQVYFHVKRVAKIHVKHLKDDFGKDYTEEIIDEITDRLFIRSIGSSTGYKVLYDLEVIASDNKPQLLINRDTKTKENLDDNIMWIDNCIMGYDDPIPQINVTRFEVQRIAETKTENVVYNPLLNSYELVKLSN